MAIFNTSTGYLKKDLIRQAKFVKLNRVVNLHDPGEIMDCIFCAIVEGKIPATKVYEDDQTLALMDINPGNPGHLLVIPKQHYRNIFDIEAEIAGKIMQVGTKLANAIKATLNPDGLNLFQSNEPAAFQTVFHFHLHLIPRWEGDSIVLPWKPQQGDLDQIKEVADKIKGHMQ